MAENRLSCSPVMIVGLSDVHQPDFAGDRRSGAGVIAGNHDDLDPGLLAFAERFRHFGPGRVFQPRQPDKDQVLLQPLPVITHSQLPAGEGKHPKALVRHRILRLHDLQLYLSAKGLNLAVNENVLA